MPRVLSIVSYKFLPPYMGGQKGIGFFNAYFSKEVDLTCITTKNNGGNSTEYTLLPVLSNSILRYVNIFCIFKIAPVIKRMGITHVIIEHPYLGWLGFLIKKTCNIKLIVHSHNIEALRFKSIGKWWWSLLYKYEGWTHRMADYSFFIQDEDKNRAIEIYSLDPLKCTTVTYGFELNSRPSDDDKRIASHLIRTSYGISPEDKILLFNGTLSYKPNLDALDDILNNINPLLLNKGSKYKIIICGNKLPGEYENLKSYKTKNIIYAGFVDDIALYFKGADIFINPVIEGGGIKTKVIEALGYNLSVITTASGAIGIPATITGDKMSLIKDQDWNAFVDEITLLNTSALTPESFYNHFYWGNIARKAFLFISGKSL